MILRSLLKKCMQSAFRRLTKLSPQTPGRGEGCKREPTLKPKPSTRAEGSRAKTYACNANQRCNKNSRPPATRAKTP